MFPVYFLLTKWPRAVRERLPSTRQQSVSLFGFTRSCCASGPSEQYPFRIQESTYFVVCIGCVVTPVMFFSVRTLTNANGGTDAAVTPIKIGQVTAFPALLVMDTNRQIAGRLDWCCCFTSAEYLKVGDKAALTKRRKIGLIRNPFDKYCKNNPTLIPFQVVCSQKTWTNCVGFSVG